MLIWIKKIFLFALLITSASLIYADTINLMTFNIACLPSPLGIQINGAFLKPNMERAQQIINVINQWNQNNDNENIPNVIALEEAFDPNVRMLLQQQLASHYPYNSGKVGEKTLNAGSGLLLFSQYPILEISFHPYQNIMAGDEWLANKGFITAKLKYNNAYFVTVIITHLESGDAIDKETQSKEATTSYRRGEQMGHIYAEIQTNASEQPKGYENLKHLKTFVMGDFNASLNNEREQKSISTGMSNNGYKKGQIKYPGQYWLFTILKNSVPTNFMDVRILPLTRGQHKSVDSVLLQQATQENKFTGSTIPNDLLKTNKNSGTLIQRQSTEFNMIDGVFTTTEGAQGNFETQLISMKEKSSYPYAMSDHLTLLGKFVFTKENLSR